MQAGNYYKVLESFKTVGINCKKDFVLFCKSTIGSGGYRMLKQKGYKSFAFVSSQLSKGEYDDHLRPLYKNELKLIKGDTYGE